MDEESTGLKARVRAVCEARGITQEEWSRSAHLSPGYLNTYLSRAEAVGRRLPEKGAEALASAARVSVEWLRFGRGSMELTPAQLPAPTPSPTVVYDREPDPAEAAIVEAYSRNPGLATSEDAVIAQRLAYANPFLLGEDREAVIATMGRFLAAVAKLRREERPVTIAAVMWELARKTTSPRQAAAAAARDMELNREAREELAQLGAVPPREPVKTPPRGTPAVMPKTVKKG